MDHCEIPRWQMIKSTLNNLSFDDFVKGCQSDSESVCLDVRTKEEYDGWHLTSAINLNYLSNTLADDLEKLSKNKTHYVYCRTSRRSLRICQLLKNMGFKKVFHLEDGVKDHIGG
ncbi:MAG: rhodanese-like domain-containing protein [Bacteroidia bacterium]|nr:rhodanese-like domain-containing protein [Bacteroidia bacterium]